MTQSALLRNLVIAITSSQTTKSKLK